MAGYLRWQWEWLGWEQRAADPQLTICDFRLPTRNPAGDQSKIVDRQSEMVRPLLP
jgi:hypothetical protein